METTMRPGHATCQGLPGRGGLLLEPWHTAVLGDKGRPDTLMLRTTLWPQGGLGV